MRLGPKKHLRLWSARLPVRRFIALTDRRSLSIRSRPDGTSYEKNRIRRWSPETKSKALRISLVMKRPKMVVKILLHIQAPELLDRIVAAWPALELAMFPAPKPRRRAESEKLLQAAFWQIARLHNRVLRRRAARAAGRQ
jgi:hypothetical protein